MIAELAGGVPLVEMPDRPGQDARYALEDGPSRADLRWAPRVSLPDGIAALVAATRG